MNSFHSLQQPVSRNYYCLQSLVELSLKEVNLFKVTQLVNLWKVPSTWKYCENSVVLKNTQICMQKSNHQQLFLPYSLFIYTSSPLIKLYSLQYLAYWLIHSRNSVSIFERIYWIFNLYNHVSHWKPGVGQPMLLGKTRWRKSN